MATWDITKMAVSNVPSYLDQDGVLQLGLSISKMKRKHTRCWGIWKKKKEMKTTSRTVPVGEACWDDPAAPVFRFRVSSPKTVSIQARLVYSNSQIREQLCVFAGTLSEGENIFRRDVDGVICGIELRIYIVSSGKNRPVCLQNCVPRDCVVGFMKNATIWNEWMQDLSKVWKPKWPCEEDELPVGFELAALVEQELKDDCIIFFKTLFPRTRSTAYQQVMQFYDRSSKALDGMKSLSAGSFHKLSKHLHYGNQSPHGPHASLSTNSLSSDEDEDLDSNVREKNPIEENKKRIQFLKRLFLFVGFAGVSLHRDEDDAGILWPYPIASIFGHGGRLLIRLEEINPAQFLHFLINGSPTGGSSSSSYPLAPFKRRIAATHQVEVDKTGELIERKLSVTNFQEVVTNMNDGIQGRHLGLDIPLGGTGNTAPVPGGKHIVGLFGQPVHTIPGRGMEVSHHMQLGHIYARIDDFGTIPLAVSPKRFAAATMDDTMESANGETNTPSASSVAFQIKARQRVQRARLHSDPTLKACRSVAELEWMRDASTWGRTIPPPPSVSALRSLIEVKLKSEAFRWYQLEGSFDKAITQLYADLCTSDIGLSLANSDGRLVLISRRAIAWVEHDGKILSNALPLDADAAMDGHRSDGPMRKKGSPKLPPKRATVVMMMRFRKTTIGEKDDRDLERSTVKPLQISVADSSVACVKGKVCLVTHIPEQHLEVDQAVVVGDEFVPSSYPGLPLKEEVTLFTFTARASALADVPFHYSFSRMPNVHPLDVEKNMFDIKTAQAWVDSLPENCETVLPPSWHALSLLLNASDTSIPIVKRLYDQLLHTSTVLRRKNKNLVLHRKVMYVRLRHEGYVLVESPPFQNADRNQSLDSLLTVKVRANTENEHNDAIKAMALRFNISEATLQESVEQTSREPIPLDDEESRLVFNDFSKSQYVVKITTSFVVTFEITQQEPFRSLGLPIVKVATHALLNRPFVVKQKTPLGIHMQNFRWVSEEEGCDSVVGFPKRQKASSPVGGRRRVLCMEEQEELQQAFQKKRISSLLIGLEGCAPGKKNPLCGEAHDASGKSSNVSACGNRKWRAYKMNSLVDAFPSACNGMRVICKPKLFHDFQAACEILIDSDVARPMPPLLKSRRPRRRSELNEHEASREIFRAILCENALGSRAVIDSAIHDKIKAKLPKTQRANVISSRRMSSFI